MTQVSLSNVLFLEGSDDGQPLQSSGDVRVDRTASCVQCMCVHKVTRRLRYLKLSQHALRHILVTTN